MNVCLDTYCTRMYYTCCRMRGVLVGGVIRACYEVNSQGDGSVCCVFIGTMIHINNLASLPTPHSFYFHLCHLISLSASTLKKERIMSRQRAENIQRAWGNEPFIPRSRKVNVATTGRQQCMHTNHLGITYPHVHMHGYVCTHIDSHTQKESHTQTEAPDAVSK